jgi:hypothetical protein
MANELIIRKVDSPPVAPYEPSTLYFYVDGSRLLSYLSNSQGTLVYRSLTDGDVGPIVSLIINTLKGAANGIATLDSYSNVIQTALLALASKKWETPITLTVTGNSSGQISIDGAQDLTLDLKHTLTNRHSPTLTYSSGKLQSLTYANGDSTTLGYVQGRLTSVSLIDTVLSKTVTKNINYNQDGTISSIVRSVI